jgi:hypothetical protein
LSGIPLATLAADPNAFKDIGMLKGMFLKSVNAMSWGNPEAWDFAPLKDMQLKAIVLRDILKEKAEVLRAIKTLEFINGKATADFWKEYDAAQKKK